VCLVLAVDIINALPVVLLKLTDFESFVYIWTVGRDELRERPTSFNELARKPLVDQLDRLAAHRETLIRVSVEGKRWSERFRRDDFTTTLVNHSTLLEQRFKVDHGIGELSLARFEGQDVFWFEQVLLRCTGGKATAAIQLSFCFLLFHLLFRLCFYFSS
jgi:hypothetical protein